MLSEGFKMTGPTIQKFYQSITNPEILIPVTEFDKTVEENKGDPDYVLFCEVIKVIK